jgi:ubiquinone/menaquinone biosynthesis C-methylase UbiE
VAVAFRLRDALRPPQRILHEVGLQPGMTVLDYGCGPGGFALAAARMVGPVGRVYAVDIHPLAVNSVARAALRAGIANIRALHADQLAALGPESVHRALLYDVLHALTAPAATLAGIQRVLKPRGTLSVSDHHMNEQELLAKATVGGLFRPAGRGRYTYAFAPARRSEVAT